MSTNQPANDYSRHFDRDYFPPDPPLDGTMSDAMRTTFAALVALCGLWFVGAGLFEIMGDDFSSARVLTFTEPEITIESVADGLTTSTNRIHGGLLIASGLTWFACAAGIMRSSIPVTVLAGLAAIVLSVMSKL